jgi:hypothetical protein
MVKGVRKEERLVIEERMRSQWALRATVNELVKGTERRKWEAGKGRRW